MPISKKVFEEGDFRKRYDNLGKHPVTLLLSKNQNLAFTVKEMSKRVKMKEETVRSMHINVVMKGEERFCFIFVPPLI